jgi:hypothetical protein
MRAFLIEVVAAIKEGPRLFFAPVIAAATEARMAAHARGAVLSEGAGSRPRRYLSSFQQYYKLADVLIEQASKEQLAECARLLALNLAHYQSNAYFVR